MIRAGPLNLDVLGELREWCPYKKNSTKNDKIKGNEWKDY